MRARGSSNSFEVGHIIMLQRSPYEKRTNAATQGKQMVSKSPVHRTNNPNYSHFHHYYAEEQCQYREKRAFNLYEPFIDREE